MVKTIVYSIIIAVSITFVVSLFVYVNSLNYKIENLNEVVNNQANTIKLLELNLESANKNICALNSTLDVTNNLVHTMKSAYEDSEYVKDRIFKEIANNPATNEWYNESIPTSIVELLNADKFTRVCENSN